MATVRVTAAILLAAVTLSGGGSVLRAAAERGPGRPSALTVSAAADDGQEPEPTHAPPSSADHVFADGEGPPVYDRPSHGFDEESWPACETPPDALLAPYDGCDPYAGRSDAEYWHYDKPYGRSAEDAVAFARWEPGRFERAGRAMSQGRGYYQSDRWRGPVSWDEGFYMDPQTRCGGYYGENLRVADQPVPFTESGGGVQGCMP